VATANGRLYRNENLLSIKLETLGVPQPGNGQEDQKREVKHYFFCNDVQQKFSINNYENNQQEALYRLIYYSKSALHVSGDVFAHDQEHLTVFTVSGSVHPSCCRLAAGSNLGEHYQLL